MKLTNAWAFDFMCCSLVIMDIFSSCFKFSRSLFWHLHIHVIFFFFLVTLQHCIWEEHTHTA